MALVEVERTSYESYDDMLDLSKELTGHRPFDGNTEL